MSQFHIAPNGIIGSWMVVRDRHPFKTGLTERGACLLLCSLVGDSELDRLSISAGVCDTELTRQARLELKRRGFTFSTTKQKWVKAGQVAQEKDK